MSSVFIPEEAKPYCNHMGIINWHAVVELIRQERGIESRLESGYQLGMILEGTMEDKHGALPIMRRLKLDEIISARRHNKHHPHFIKSKELAEKFAADFDIDINQVPGTGPDGIVLKRDIIAYRRFLRAGKIAAIHPQEPSVDDGEVEGAPPMGGLTPILDTLIPIGNAKRVHVLTAELHRARMRIMAAHMAQKNREIRMLQRHFNTNAKLLQHHAENARSNQATIEALQSRIAAMESREIHVESSAPRQIHITLNLDAAR